MQISRLLIDLNFRSKPFWRIALGYALSLSLVCASALIRYASIGEHFILSGNAAAKPASASSARLSQDISVRAVGQGNSSINLSDGRVVITEYIGPAELIQALQSNQAQPLTLASADFDEDGVPDLISGYANSNSGIITIMRGNVDAIYPNSPEAQQRRATGTFTDSPFLSPARVFESPQPPDFIGAGDFDGDGHWDVVATRRGGDKLYLFSGDGGGVLNLSKEIGLPGAVTAMTVGEMNRRDGLDDVVVGIDANQALIFEGPEGALRAQPEVFNLPAPPTSVALGQLDNEDGRDLAIAAGREVIIIHGRDRKLSLGERERADIAPTRVSRCSLPFKVKDLALGNFSGEHQVELASLSEDGSLHLLSEGRSSSKGVKRRTERVGQWRLREGAAIASWPQATKLSVARVSGLGGDDLIVLDSANRQLHIVSDRRSAESGRQDAGESPSEVVTLNTEGETRAVLKMRLNAHASDSLVLSGGNRSGPSVVLARAAKTFTVNTAADHDDGACDTGDCTLREAITASNASPGADMIAFDIKGGTAPSIVISLMTDLPRLADPVIIDGTTQPGFSGLPVIQISGSSLSIINGKCTVRGLIIPEIRIARTADTTSVNENSYIEGNFFGADLSGSGIGNGVTIFRSFRNRIGGTVTQARNIVSGIDIDQADGSVIQGNYIGVDKSGAKALSNSAGVVANESTGVTIGGLAGGSRNVISGSNSFGVWTDTLRDTLLQGNYIGVDSSGALALPNARGGVRARNVLGTIGGATPNAGNVISANNGSGIGVAQSGFLIQGNLIGTDWSGVAALGNSMDGVLVEGAGATIGGEPVQARNIISGNRGVGVKAERESRVSLIGNYIGTDTFGSAAIPNNAGVDISDSYDEIVIENNLVSGNSRFGVSVRFCRNARVNGNLIGVNFSGASALPNGEGITVVFSPGIVIGGMTAQSRNVISGNNGDGITMLDTPRATIQGNFIGTDASGTRAVPNSGNGVLFSLVNYDSPPLALIGGETDNARNLISGNFQHGVAIGPPRNYINDKGATVTANGGEGVTVQRNIIGADITGERDLGNGGHGVFLDNRTFIHTIKENRIAFNKGSGVFVPNQGSGLGAPGVQIRISENSIFSNVGLGIDLGEPGVTPNHDPGVAPEANDGQNFPELISITSDGSRTIVRGTLKSKPNTVFNIEFFSNSAGSVSAGQFAAGNVCKPEGQKFNYSSPVTTGPDGRTSFEISFPKSTVGDFVNCTATSASGDRAGNTSEFSECMRSESADLSVRFGNVNVSPAGAPAGGSELTYSLLVANAGPAAAKSVTLSNRLSENAAFTSITPPAGWTCSPGQVAGFRSVVCVIESFSVTGNASLIFTVKAKINSDTPDGARIIYTAKLISETPDPQDPGVEVTDERITGSPPADLSLAVSSAPNTVFAGDKLTYRLTVTNLGPNTAQGVTLTTSVPEHTTFLSGSVTRWISNLPPVGGRGQITYSNGKLAAGESAIFTIVVKVDPGTRSATPINFMPNVSSSSYDPQGTNNSPPTPAIINVGADGPFIQEITVSPEQITATGFGLASELSVFVDDVGFLTPARVENGRRVTQTGRLRDGRSIIEAIPPGRAVRIRFRNKNGGQTEITFKN